MKPAPVGHGGASGMRGVRAATGCAHTENLRPTIWLRQDLRRFDRDQ